METEIGLLLTLVWDKDSIDRKGHKEESLNCSGMLFPLVLTDGYIMNMCGNVLMKGNFCPKMCKLTNAHQCVSISLYLS